MSPAPHAGADLLCPPPCRAGTATSQVRRERGLPKDRNKGLEQAWCFPDSSPTTPNGISLHSWLPTIPVGVCNTRVNVCSHTESLEVGNGGRGRRVRSASFTILLLSHRGLQGEHGWWEGAGKGPGGWHCLGEARASAAHPKARSCGVRDRRLRRSSGTQAGEKFFLKPSRMGR